MVRSPFSFRHCGIQAAVVVVASLASTFFHRADLQAAPATNARPVGALNSFAACSFAMSGKNSWRESFHRFDDGKDGGLERGRKFFPSGDYLGQIMS